MDRNTLAAVHALFAPLANRVLSLEARVMDLEHPKKLRQEIDHESGEETLVPVEALGYKTGV
jgi:hypothetical protein